MNNNDLEKFEKDMKNTTGDYVHKMIKTGTGMIPGIGGAVSEVFSTVISEPLSKRKDKWLEEIINALIELENRVDGFSIESLKDNEEFVTVITNATQIAIRNHNEEKLLALKNMCLNVAENRLMLDNDKQLIFLQYVDKMLPLDILIMHHFRNPKSNCTESKVDTSRYYMGTPNSVLFDCFNSRNQEYEEVIVKLRIEELKRMQLLTEFGNASSTVEGMLTKRTSALGDEFMSFISANIMT